ncbi:MAG: heat-inducible transcriptional repressor HrcA [Chloroflexi bacterium]|nr:heat-inducible transcriptional repressor HrcA [Chloroflexota bacterium]
MTLTERQSDLLRRLVEHYVETASPISSSGLVQRDSLSISSATVRHELAELEEAGLVSRPHTSAGVVPTEQGYRHYVEMLLVRSELPAAQQRMIRHQFHQVELDEASWVRLAAATLAQVATALAIITPAQTRHRRLRALELVPLTDMKAILVEVLDGGRVYRVVVEFDSSATASEMETMGHRLSERYVGLTRGEIMALMVAPVDDLERGTMVAALGLIERADLGLAEEPFVYGFRQVMNQPEFLDIALLRGLLEAIEAGTLLAALRPENLPLGDLRVVIGPEHAREFLYPYGAVVASYGDAGSGQGTLAVIGPTRMPYSTAIPSVRYVAGLLTEIVHDQAVGGPEAHR